MRVRLLSIVAAVTMAAACNAGKDSPKSGSSGKKDAASASKAGKIAAAMKLHGVYLEEVGADATATAAADPTAAAADPTATTAATANAADPTASTPPPDLSAAEVEALLESAATPPTGATDGVDTSVTPPAPLAQGQASVPGVVPPQGQPGVQTSTQPLAQGMPSPQGLPQNPPQCVAGCDDQSAIFGKAHVSRFIVTILDDQQSPVVGAQLAIKRMENRGKKGFQEMDSVSAKATRSNKFVVWVASGRHYSLAASAKGYDLLLKELKIDSNRAVDVEFPVILSSGGVAQAGSGGDDGMMLPDQQQPPQQQLPDDQPQNQGQKGYWGWCMQVADGGPQQGYPMGQDPASVTVPGQVTVPAQVTVPGQTTVPAPMSGQVPAVQQGITTANIAAQPMQQPMVDLDRMMQQVPQDPAMLDALQTMRKMRQDGYVPRNFGCGPDHMRIKWWNGKDLVTQTIPQAPLQQKFPLGPQLPQQVALPQQGSVATPPAQVVPADTAGGDPAAQPVVTPQIAPAQPQAEGLLACNRENTDFRDVYEMISSAKMTDVIKQLKAKIGNNSGVHFQTCTASRPNLTFGFTDGSTLQFDASAISDDYWM